MTQIIKAKRKVKIFTLSVLLPLEDRESGNTIALLLISTAFQQPINTTSLILAGLLETSEDDARHQASSQHTPRGHTANAYWEDNSLDKLSFWISVLDSVLEAHIEGSPLPKEDR